MEKQYDKELVCVLTCPCHPNKNYMSRNTFRAHFKSQRHQFWDQKINLQSHIKKIVDLENKILSLKVECDMWKSQAILLKQKYEPVHILD
jgi:hypothetical protein